MLNLYWEAYWYYNDYQLYHSLSNLVLLMMSTKQNVLHIKTSWTTWHVHAVTTYLSSNRMFSAALYIYGRRNAAGCSQSFLATPEISLKPQYTWREITFLSIILLQFIDNIYMKSVVFTYQANLLERLEFSIFFYDFKQKIFILVSTSWQKKLSHE